IDFGSQYSMLIARRVRECQVYCELLPHDTPWEKIAPLNPRGFILSGGPASVYDSNVPLAPAYVYESHLPVLGICYGMQAITKQLGGQVTPGIRVGVTVAKILAYSTNKPVAGVPTLEVLAYNARNTPAQICPIIYAGTKDTVYSAFYRTKNDTVTRVGEYYVGDLKGLSERVKESTVFTGAEAKAYCQLIGNALGSSGIDIKAIEAAPSGAVVALLAASRLAQGESDDALSLTPLYLKESTARAFQSKYS
ncbi:unnamed protein product, partial [marine sediment metagenome]